MSMFATICDRNTNGNVARGALALTLIGRLPNSGVSIGCQHPRDKNKHVWGVFGSRNRFVDMHHR